MLKKFFEHQKTLKKTYKIKNMKETCKIGKFAGYSWQWIMENEFWWLRWAVVNKIVELPPHLKL